MSDLVARYFEVFNKGDAAAMLALVELDLTIMGSLDGKHASAEFSVHGTYYNLPLWIELVK